MQGVTRCGLALSLLLCACVSEGGNTSPTRNIDQGRNGAPQLPSAPASGSADSGGPVPGFAVVSQNVTGTEQPKDAGLGGLDASNPADGATSAHDAASDAAGAAPFACQRNSDCQITNIFSCCGYFPRCANTTANFAPPDCSQGQVGVCSLPLIDHCECRQRTCVDVQSVTAK